jgi:phosphoglycerate-specific signal transduction histidine kinase
MAYRDDEINELRRENAKLRAELKHRERVDAHAQRTLGHITLGLVLGVGLLLGSLAASYYAMAHHIYCM